MTIKNSKLTNSKNVKCKNQKSKYYNQFSIFKLLICLKISSPTRNT